MRPCKAQLIHYRALLYQALVKPNSGFCYWYKLQEKVSRSWYHTWFSVEIWCLTRTRRVKEMALWGLGSHQPIGSESAALLGQVHQQT